MNIGETMHAWARDLWPINRSLTGPGNRETLAYLAALLPGLRLHSERTGARVCDWTIPPEWHCREAWIETEDGRRLCDYATNNLHLVGYSKAIDRTLSLQELMQHVHTIPEQPDHIPYITSYYADNWGFCMSHHDSLALEEGMYRVRIDSEHSEGSLDYADLIIPGESTDEILLSTYICHPSMANNELSGPVVVTALARWLMSLPRRRYSYRIVFTPETIGAVTYICHNKDMLMDRVVAGYQVTTVGDDRTYSYVASPYEDTVSDTVAKEVMAERGLDYKHYPFLERGSDERQYCSPGIRLPIASMCRSKYAEYPEYHTSADNLTDVVTPSGLMGAFELYKACLTRLESMDKIPRQPSRHRVAGCPDATCVGEPQLGRRNLYKSIGHTGGCSDTRMLVNILAYCDGSNTLEELAELTDTTVDVCRRIVELLRRHDLVTDAIA